MIEMIEWSLREDLGECDHTSASSLPEGLNREGWILAKEDGVVAGLEVAKEVFGLVDPNLTVEMLCKDGDRVTYGQPVFRISGDARRILEGERLALNFIQRMSGIASRTADVMASFQVSLGIQARSKDFQGRANDHIHSHTRETDKGKESFIITRARLARKKNNKPCA